MENFNLKNNLDYFSESFYILVNTIKTLKNQNMLLSESLYIVEEIQNNLVKTQGYIRNLV